MHLRFPVRRKVDRMSKFVEFEEISKTNILVRNKKDKARLGFIEYNNHWKKFVYCPEEMTYYDCICLTDIADELKKRDVKLKGESK